MRICEADFRLRNPRELDDAGWHALLQERPAQAIVAGARAGVLQAQALLGQLLLDGQGIAQDAPLAVKWFAIAAHRGHLMARNMLGRCHEHGWGCVADASAAAGHYRLAAEAGLDWAMYNYANLLATGRGVATDQALALSWYRRAAQLGHAKSMNLLGRYLEQGLACAADVEQARQWYQRSAEAGDFRGQFSHAAVLAEQGEVAAALHWLQLALEGGNLNFLRVSVQVLEQAAQPQVRAMAVAYRARMLSLAS
ncbi:tetratricopeptide repeat protein [Pseudomonas sp. HR96]|uniref:tetratricopeptide repeat protein n=1 Tax=Pseudomonas sp. HR96 TaxID=1027966 RepID=UPI002A7600CD|nr:tetratricopeptide repeat protein [Pseudomonas sp. HR96]WPO99289.1 tetratricopeptide repeat protein [Pseudomonas sp. HR96]